MIDFTNISELLNEKKTLSAKRGVLDQLNFKKLGEGSGRTVYEINNDQIVKVAKNQKGLAQNEVEAGLSPTSEIFAKVLRSGDEDSWLLCQKAQKLTRSEFKRKIGVDFNDYGFMIKRMGADLKGSLWIDGDLEKENQILVEENPFFLKVVQTMADEDLSAGDLARITSYGIVDGKVVITDYGLTHEVFKRFYKKKKTSDSWDW